jgi:hypothetical protein
VASAAASTAPPGQDPCDPNNNWLLRTKFSSR